MAEAATETGFAERRAAKRQRTREGIAQWATVPVSAGQRRRDPLRHPPSSFSRTLARVGGLAAASFSIHVLGIVLSMSTIALFGTYAIEEKPERDAVVIRMADVPPPELPDVEVAPSIVPPPPQPEAPPRPEPRAEPTPPPPDPIDVPAAAPEPAVQPRRRVVGLSFESTVVGGSGPSFAVGNTRMGTTEKKAAEPTIVEKLQPSNRKATRIPVRGVRLVKPKRRAAIKPDYPELLRARGIEGDVAVIVSLDATGAVKGVQVAKPSPHPELNEAAKRAAWRESFEPAQRGGEPVAYMLKFTYRFRLEEL